MGKLEAVGLVKKYGGKIVRHELAKEVFFGEEFNI